MNKNNTTKREIKDQRLIDAKISLLQLAEELGNIQRACKVAGIARSSFYEIKRAYEKFGRQGLLSLCKGKKIQEVHKEEEKRILEFTRTYPSYSYKRLTDQIQLAGFGIGESVVRRVWKKHRLERRVSRFLWLDKEALQGRGTLTEEMIKVLKRLKASHEASDRHIQVSQPGELICQDLYFVGRIKGVGKVYMQSAVDCYNSLGFAKLSVSKKPLYSVALLHERVLPFYDRYDLKIGSILTDNGREYCGCIDSHLYETYLGAQGIEHRRTKTASPWTNGFVERFHRTVKEEFFSKVFREKWYESVEELQKDLDVFIRKYNEERCHQGYRTKGRTPLQTLRDWMKNPNKQKGGETAA